MTRGRVTAVAAFAVSLVGVAVFGSLVAGVAAEGWDWAEDRDFETVAPWAVPGLMLAVLAGHASSCGLFLRKGREIGLVFRPVVPLSVGSLILLNPTLTPALY